MMKIFDLKNAIEGIGRIGNEDKTLKDKLGEIKDDESLNEFYEEWKKFLKTTYLSLHPDKNPGKSTDDFKYFHEKATLINEYIDIFTKNDNGKRKFKDEYNKEAFLKSTKAINETRESDFSNLDSGLNKDSSPNTKSPNRENSLSAENLKSFEDLCKEIDWTKVFQPEPQKKASWLASIDESGNLVVINSKGKKDLNSKILENPFLLIANENTKVDDRIEVNSNTISGVIRIISNKEMKKIIAENGDAKVDNNNQETITTPPDLSFASFRAMMGKYDEKAFKESSFVSKYLSSRENTNQDRDR